MSTPSSRSARVLVALHAGRPDAALGILAENERESWTVRLKR